MLPKCNQHPCRKHPPRKLSQPPPLVCPSSIIATPRAPEASAAKAEHEPIPEIKSPGVLAQEAKAKLDELLKGGSTPPKPAVGNNKPHLPTQSGFFDSN